MDLLVAAAAAAAAAAAPARAASPLHPQRTSTEQRWSVVALYKDGRSERHIARHLVISRPTVRAILARYAATGSPGSGSRSGRPRATTEEERTNLFLASLKDPFSPPRAIRHTLDLDCSPRTVARCLDEGGLFGRVARRKPGLSAATIRDRIAFAEGYTRMDWSTVLFSDEKIFWGDGFCGRTWVRRPEGEALNPLYVKKRTAHPVKVNVWACFAASGQGFIYIFNENLDAALMKRILKDNLVASAERLFPPGVWYFLHDNDKKFKSKLVQEWLDEKDIRRIDFPAYSPDLNPMENLWAVLAREVEKTPCSTMEELQDCVERNWEKASKPLMAELVASMPRRCAAVIAAAGSHTKY